MDSKITKMIDDERYNEALEALDHAIEKSPGDAWLWYERGRLYWRMQRHGNAISDFEEAVHLDPQSPAAAFLEMARDVMDFYNTDMLNP